MGLGFGNAKYLFYHLYAFTNLILHITFHTDRTVSQWRYQLRCLSPSMVILMPDQLNRSCAVDRWSGFNIIICLIWESTQKREQTCLALSPLIFYESHLIVYHQHNTLVWHWLILVDERVP